MCRRDNIAALSVKTGRNVTCSVHPNRRVFVVLFALTASGTPNAQLADGLDLHLYRPSVDSKGHLSVNGSDILGHTDVSFGLVLDYGRDLLPYRGFINDEGAPADDATRIDHLVDNSVSGTLHLNVGLLNHLVIGVQVPIVFMQGPNATVPGVYNDAVNDTSGLDVQGIGDITVHAKVRLLRAERAPIGLAAVLRAQIPTGDARGFSGEPGVALWPSAVLEWRPRRRFRLGLELGYRLIFGDGARFPLNGRSEPTGMNATMPSAPVDAEQIQYNDLLTFGLGMSLRVTDGLDVVAEAYGAQIATEFGTPGAVSAEALLGLKIFVQANSYLMLAGGAGITPDSLQAARMRLTAAFVFEPSIGDRDGDGYKDDADQCPDEPEDFDTFADADGCPDPGNDRDGHLDDDDECPLVPEDRDGDADHDGCPEGNEGDRDGDGILDTIDECPDFLRKSVIFPTTRGDRLALFQYWLPLVIHDLGDRCLVT